MSELGKGSRKKGLGKGIRIHPHNSRAEMFEYYESGGFPEGSRRLLDARKAKFADNAFYGTAKMIRTTKIWPTGQNKKIGVSTIGEQRLPAQSEFLLSEMQLLWTGVLADSNEATVANAEYKPIFNPATGAISAGFTMGVLTIRNTRKEIVSELPLSVFASKDEKRGRFGLYKLDNARLLGGATEIEVTIDFYEGANIPDHAHISFTMFGTSTVPA